MRLWWDGLEWLRLRQVAFLSSLGGSLELGVGMFLHVERLSDACLPDGLFCIFKALRVEPNTHKDI